MMHCARHVQGLGLPDNDRDMILGGHAEAILSKTRKG